MMEGFASELLMIKQDVKDLWLQVNKHAEKHAAQFSSWQFQQLHTIEAIQGELLGILLEEVVKLPVQERPQQK